MWMSILTIAMIVVWISIFFILYICATDDGHRPENPKWEVVPARENGHVIGFKVRWSQPDEEGRYLWVGHYYTGEETSEAWCEVAAANHAERLNQCGVGPWEYTTYRPRE